MKPKDKLKVYATELATSVDFVKNVIQKRLNYAESQLGFEPGSLIQIDDAAYRTICELTQNSVGLSLEVFRRVLPSPKQLSEKHPYVITEEHVKALGITYEDLCKYWDSPFRSAMVIELKPWWKAE